MHHPIDRIAHTMAFVTPVVEHWLELWLEGTELASQYWLQLKMGFYRSSG